MLYDLNIAWSPSTPASTLLATLAQASALGYDTVALNHTLTLPFPAAPTSPFPPLPRPSSPSQKLPAVLRRATLPLADPAASNYRLSSLLPVYDILAIRPLTRDAFQNACLTLDVPIISIDLTQQLGYYFRPKPCMAAVLRGVRFEVCYAQALRADHRGRANFIANASGLVRATRGRGIILSSEAGTPLDLRGPADVINLLSVWGLGNDKGMDGLRSIPRSVVVNEGIKRNGFRGVVEVVEVAKKPEPSVGQKEPEDSAASSRQKRKNAGQDESGQLSKRQLKKMKLAARTANAGGPGKA
ncbi:hypothetical protein S40293_02342 [Stachybotrys chartarum IBT 40293]|nr:hypothetical protein S40293_02342 [Stachybotrys chartarum IBT 40293]